MNANPVVLGIAWGVFPALLLQRVASRRATLQRARGLGPQLIQPAAGATVKVQSAMVRMRGTCARALGPVDRVCSDWRRRRALVREHRAIEAELPVYVELLGVGFGAGCVPFTALALTLPWAPPTIAPYVTRVLERCALGAALAEALGPFDEGASPLFPVANALLVTERTGAPVGPALERLAIETRAVNRRRAEVHARTIPVRLLFPLVFLVLPAFASLTVVPVLLTGFTDS